MQKNFTARLCILLNKIYYIIKEEVGITEKVYNFIIGCFRFWVPTCYY